MSIYKNLFNFQSKIRTIEKDSKGYNYKYASFDNIVSTINQALIDSNLGYYHYFEETESKMYCVCVLFSADSDNTDTITVKLPLDNPENGKSKMSAIQQLGASVTYARRYTLTAALGLVTEEDTDGIKKQPPTQKPQMDLEQIKGKIQRRLADVGLEQTLKEAKSKYQVSEVDEEAIRAMAESALEYQEEEINTDEIEF